MVHEVPHEPLVNDHLIELLALANACRRAAAAHVTAILPYFGYARADKRHGRREPITARTDQLVTYTESMSGLYRVDNT